MSCNRVLGHLVRVRVGVVAMQCPSSFGCTLDVKPRMLFGDAKSPYRRLPVGMHVADNISDAHKE